MTWHDKIAKEILDEILDDINVVLDTFPALPMIGVEVTHIVPPEQGWPIAVYCPICRTLSFLYCAYGIKPEKGDYFLMRSCVDDLRHSLELSNPLYNSGRRDLYDDPI